ncbi:MULTISPECIES: hypothetical protein [Lawsonella]|jgi:hypothetical protein|uniref:Magnesium transporter CorA n=1 Tax=Lawsonella clevelandensis TaxID=1528099 RepID=A0A2W5K9A8_9ACTN|nr:MULTISPECIES: hypothetical protein [Lawsonella]PZP89062.1 MAG: magnesium transporter CorA [Lawsonella clevelandensis]GHT86633.1 hypothetical protein FACS1894129_7150 [Actinomycetota bacterium]
MGIRDREDITLEVEPRDVGRDAYKETYESTKWWWDKDSSFLAKIAYEDGSQATLASGWHKRQIEFEYPGVKFKDLGLPGELNSVGYIPIGRNEINSDQVFKNIESYEIEISLDGISEHTDTIKDFLNNFVPEQTTENLLESMGEIIRRVSANRANQDIDDGFGGQIPTVDLLCQNLPARSGKNPEPLRTLYRWCRIFDLSKKINEDTPKGTITIYEKIPKEQKTQRRWPHNCIWLNRGKDYYTEYTQVGSPLEAFTVPIEYELYNLENWKVEFERWETMTFKIASNSDPDIAADQLNKCSEEMGKLSEFVGTASLAVRNLHHKAENSSFVTKRKIDDVKEEAEKQCTAMHKVVNDCRECIEKASEFLANTAQSVEALAGRKNAETTVTISRIVSILGLLFTIPTLVISFYSMGVFTTDKK